MPWFQCKARKPSGELVVESIEGESPVTVARRLSSSGLIPVSIREAASGAKSAGAGPLLERVKASDLIMFTRQLVTLYKAGLPFLSSLDVIGKQTGSPVLQRVIGEIRSDVEGGTTLSAALAKHPRVFPEVYVSTVVAGETGGVLDEVMERLVALLEHELETRQTIKGALRYPAMVVGAMVIAFFVIVVFVIPTFAELFAKAGQALPLPTRIMVAVNELRKHYWHVGLVGLAGAIGASVWYLRTSRGRLRFDTLVLKVPLIGPIIVKATMSRLAHMFGTLGKSGLPILTELAVVSRTIGNRRIARQIEAARDAVHKGSNLAAAIKKETEFPDLVKHMIAVGEKTGAMTEMMEAVGEHYDREAKASIARLTQALEPLITVVLGVGLLFIALAVFLPMWDMMQVAGR